MKLSCKEMVPLVGNIEHPFIFIFQTSIEKHPPKCTGKSSERHLHFGEKQTFDILLLIGGCSIASHGSFRFFLGCKQKCRYDPNQKYEPISDQRLTAENETETKEAEEVLWPSVFFAKSSLLDFSEKTELPSHTRESLKVE